jgi:dephospho-CoA kinase
MIIAITGYIGTGKTTAAAIFREKGWYVVNADEMGHAVLRDREIRDKLLAKFGSDIADRSMEIDREKLGKAVFSNDGNLQFLNSIAHPIMIAELRTFAGTKDKLVIDVALYERLHIDKIADKAILVKSDVDRIFERLKNRFTQEQVIRIMNSQEQPKNPDYIIENNGTIEQFREKIERLIGDLA